MLAEIQAGVRLRMNGPVSLPAYAGMPGHDGFYAVSAKLNVPSVSLVSQAAMKLKLGFA